MKNEILFIGGTHGDEPIGVEILKGLEQERQDFDWIIGNPKALEKGEREFEGDLNRSGPGDPKAKNYASRRAAEIIEQTQNYRYVVDVHGSIKDMGIFIIITNPTEENLKLASLLNINRIAIWPSVSSEQSDALSEYYPCGIEIECGEKNNPVIKQQIHEALVDFLDSREEREQVGWETRLQQKQLFIMSGPLKRSECPNPEQLREFKETKVNGEKFHPIFIGAYDYDDILCYKLKPISLEQVLSLK